MVKGRKFGFGGLGFGTNPMISIVIIALIVLFITFLKNVSTDKVTSKFGDTPSSQSNLAVVQWATGYTTTKLPLSKDTYWISFLNKDDRYIAVLYKFQNTFVCIASYQGKWHIFTSPSLTTPIWTQVPYIFNIIRLIELKDGKGYAGICPDNNLMVKSPSLTKPTWELVKVSKGTFKAIELYQLQDGTFACIATNDILWLADSLDSGDWYLAPVGGAMIQLLEAPGKNGSYSFVCVNRGGAIFFTSSLKYKGYGWRESPIGGGLTNKLIQLKDGTFLSVGTGGGLYTTSSLTDGWWTKVSDNAKAGNLLLEY